MIDLVSDNLTATIAMPRKPRRSSKRGSRLDQQPRTTDLYLLDAHASRGFLISQIERYDERHGFVHLEDYQIATHVEPHSSCQLPVDTWTPADSTRARKQINQSAGCSVG
jgi:hypothetical protein